MGANTVEAGRGSLFGKFTAVDLVTIAVFAVPDVVKYSSNGSFRGHKEHEAKHKVHNAN